MKYEPLNKSDHIGCLCSKCAEIILPKDTTLDVGFGDVTLSYENEDGDRTWLWSDASTIHTDHSITLSELEHVFKNLLQQDMCFILHFYRPLSEETYEYNREDGQWYLIEQGQGFA